jgi:hypothetical protein
MNTRNRLTGRHSPTPGRLLIIGRSLVRVQAGPLGTMRDRSGRAVPHGPGWQQSGNTRARPSGDVPCGANGSRRSCWPVGNRRNRVGRESYRVEATGPGGGQLQTEASLDAAVEHFRAEVLRLAGEAGADETA